MSRSLTFCQAIREAQDQAMERDPRVFVIGEGADDPKTIFGSTAQLPQKYGKERIFDIPLSENGMTGVIMGAALAGMRPIMTHQRIDFTMYAMDQIVNHAAKRAYASGGRQGVPFVIRAIVGRGWGQGPQHSQSLQALFAHIPGLKVLMPATAYDAKGLLLAAIEDNNPCIFIEHRRLYEAVSEVPEEYYTVPIGQGKIRAEGKDLTIVAISFMEHDAFRARAALESIGITAEIIDPRTLKPLDNKIILESVRKTGRLIVADTAWRTCGLGSEIAATVAEEAFSSLKARPRRICSPDSPTPTSYALEQIYYPGALEIVRAACEICNCDDAATKKAMAAIPPADVTKISKFVGPF